MPPPYPQDGCLWVLCALGTHQDPEEQELVATLIADLAESSLMAGAMSRRVQIARGGGMHALMALYAATRTEAPPRAVLSCIPIAS